MKPQVEHKTLGGMFSNVIGDLEDVLRAACEGCRSSRGEVLRVRGVRFEDILIKVTRGDRQTKVPWLLPSYICPAHVDLACCTGLKKHSHLVHLAVSKVFKRCEVPFGEQQYEPTCSLRRDTRTFASNQGTDANLLTKTIPEMHIQ